MRKIYSTLPALLIATTVFGQEDSTKTKDLETVVITGQYKPQSLKNSVYLIRNISQERIRLSGATNVQQVLNKELGFRFSNDNTLGTTDVQLMGMNGRNVKILLDGVPLTDRGDTRESLDQVDINTIEKIEIVDGPMSVSYGSDALAGTINIITKKKGKDDLSVTAKFQEETAGNEYYPFSYKGVHMQHIGISGQKNGWRFALGGTHNDMDGFGGDAYGREKSWRPKEQWMGNATAGYSNNFFTIYYRLDALQEKIINRDTINYLNYKAIDKRYTTNRLMHQVQAQFRFNNKANLATILSYTDYERRTRTTRHNFETGTDELTTGAGEQDISGFNALVFRNTLSYEFSKKISFQPGIDINYEKANGQRIAGNPSITDYAIFASAEIKATDKINIRPGLRFIKNSVYDAPPVIPSLNAKIVLNKKTDLRLAYAYGFRSPALRELYFSFHDANHDIDGNPNLKAEHSNSFTGSLNWLLAATGKLRLNSALTGFYNVFSNQIDLALGTGNVYTYFNINRSKTAGGSIDNRISWKKWDASAGFSLVGYYGSQYTNSNYVKEDDRKFLWTPEINSSITYRLDKYKTILSLFYKYTGVKPAYNFGTNTANQEVIYIAKTSSFSLADLTASTILHKCVTLNAGIRNIFDVTNINSTSASTAHNAGGPLPMSYGRSYFLGLNFQWNKK